MKDLSYWNRKSGRFWNSKKKNGEHLVKRKNWGSIALFLDTWINNF